MTGSVRGTGSRKTSCKVREALVQVRVDRDAGPLQLGDADRVDEVEPGAQQHLVGADGHREQVEDLVDLRPGGER